MDMTCAQPVWAIVPNKRFLRLLAMLSQISFSNSHTVSLLTLPWRHSAYFQVWAEQLTSTQLSLLSFWPIFYLTGKSFGGQRTHLKSQYRLAPVTFHSNPIQWSKTGFMGGKNAFILFSEGKWAERVSRASKVKRLCKKQYNMKR